MCSPARPCSPLPTATADATNVNAGTLRAGAPNTFSPNSAVTVASGGTLDLAGFDQTIPGLINHGMVRTGGSPGTGPGTMLTVAGNYTAGSILALNTFLAGDGSPSDRLVINGGTATGTTGIDRHQHRWPRALTTGDGILVVDATNGGTTAPGAFALGAPVVAGPFEYRSIVARSTARQRRSLVPAQQSTARSVPPNPDCVGPTPPAPRHRRSPAPNIRQEVSVYAAMPAAAAIYGRQIIDTLHERMGGDAQRLGPGDNGTYDATPDGVWGRVIGLWGHRDGPGVICRRTELRLRLRRIPVRRRPLPHGGPDGSRDNAGLYAPSAMARLTSSTIFSAAPSMAARMSSMPTASAATGRISDQTTGMSTAFCRRRGTTRP